MMPSSPYCPTRGAANPPQAAFCFACGQALSTGAGLQTGLLPASQLLRQRYRILAQVGKGGFGAVYQAGDTQFCVYREHSGAVRSLAWSPDGTRIASGGLDKTVHVWQPTW